MVEWLVYLGAWLAIAAAALIVYKRAVYPMVRDAITFRLDVISDRLDHIECDSGTSSILRYFIAQLRGGLNEISMAEPLLYGYDFQSRRRAELLDRQFSLIQFNAPHMLGFAEDLKSICLTAACANSPGFFLVALWWRYSSYETPLQRRVAARWLEGDISDRQAPDGGTYYDEPDQPFRDVQSGDAD